MRLTSSVIFGITLVSFARAAGAQDAPYTFTVAPYVMFTGMTGTVAIEEFPAASVNRASPGPFSDLHAGGGVLFEVRQRSVVVRAQREQRVAHADHRAVSPR